LPEHVVTAWASAKGNRQKQGEIANAAFKRSVKGRYSLDVAQPMFAQKMAQAFRNRDNESYVCWKKEAKPRSLWAIDFADAGGTYF